MKMVYVCYKILMVVQIHFRQENKNVGICLHTTTIFNIKYTYQTDELRKMYEFLFLVFLAF